MSKHAAIAAFESAIAAPGDHDWQAIAAALAASLATKAKPKPAAKADPGTPMGVPFKPWCDSTTPHKLRKSNGKRTIITRFADGRVTRASASEVPGKPFNIGRAMRVACTFYRHQLLRAMGGPHWVTNRGWRFDVEHIDVAEIVSVECEDTGERWDAAIANRMTAEYRASA